MNADSLLLPNTIACCKAALAVTRDSLSEPSRHFPVEVQRLHQAEIDDALANLRLCEAVEGDSGAFKMPADVLESLRYAFNAAYFDISASPHVDRVRAWLESLESDIHERR